MYTKDIEGNILVLLPVYILFYMIDNYGFIWVYVHLD